MRKINVALVLAFICLSVGAFSLEKPKAEMLTLSFTDETSFIGYYSDLLKNNEKVLMTKDLMFYAEHLLLDYSLYYIEEKFLCVELDAMLDILIEGVKKRMNESKKESLKDSYMMALSYLSVSKKCLDSNYPLIKPIAGNVEKELMKIENHSGFDESPVFSKKEDYSQYIPRGHYTRTKNLEKYFKAMMYLMRMRFSTETKNQDTFDELKAALILSSTLKSSSKAKYHYERINNAVSVLLPKEDDLCLTELSDSIGEIVDDDFLCDKGKMMKAKETAARLSDSKILSDYKKDNEAKTVVVGFMGQRYIFDSEVFQNLVYDKVTEYKGKGKPFTLFGSVRAMPRGLDLMYILGSGKAYEILESEGDAQYEDYSENSVLMKKKAKDLSKESFYNRMLLQYKNVISERKESSPSFMLDEKYQLKELNSLLASWASLRHDVILYAKQSYTVKVTSAAPKEAKQTKIIAESYNTLYKIMREDAVFLVDNLNQIFNDGYIEAAGDAFTNLCLIYSEISDITMKNGYYYESDSLRSALLTMDNALKVLLVNQSEREDNIEIVSDVHTDSNSEMVLQEGVGPVLCMNVSYRGEDFTGGAMSYFEFKNPMSERLTDEEWRAYLKENDMSKLLFKWQKKIYD
ncbi:MAG: DUF3160 domain-containing protein [bacterium]